MGIINNVITFFSKYSYSMEAWNSQFCCHHHNCPVVIKALAFQSRGSLSCPNGTKSRKVLHIITCNYVIIPISSSHKMTFLGDLKPRSYGKTILKCTKFGDCLLLDQKFFNKKTVYCCRYNYKVLNF